MAKKKQNTKKTSRTTRKRANSPPTVIVRSRPRRRNAAPKSTTAPRRNAAANPALTVQTRNAATVAAEPESERTPIQERVQEMGGVHVAAGVGAGALGNMLGVLAVGKGWLGPKTTASILVGSGAAAATAGYFWESDHLMAAGAGLAAAGTFSLSNQYAIDAYESVEERAKEKREERERKDMQKRLAEARLLIEAEKKEQIRRNGARHVVVLDAQGNEIGDGDDDDHGDDEFEDDDYRDDVAA